MAEQCRIGLEPPQPFRVCGFKSAASANSAIPALRLHSLYVMRSFEAVTPKDGESAEEKQAWSAFLLPCDEETQHFQSSSELRSCPGEVAS
jgi:hypothetical protein